MDSAERPLLNHLRALADARLVTAASPEAFEFRHALTREAVYSTLLKRQRVLYHGLVADILEAQDNATPTVTRAADLAYHYREAVNWPKALAYAQQAGEQAQNQYAPREAAQHFSLALEAAAQLGQPPHLALLRGRGQAYEVLGEFEPARADYERALSAARAASGAEATRAEWQALLDLGFLWAGREYARTGDYFQQALALAHTGGDPLTIAQSLNRLGNWLINVGQIEAGLGRHQEALEIFQAQGSDAGMAATHDMLALGYAFAGNLIASAEHTELAIALFRQIGDKRGLITSLGAHNSLTHVSDIMPWSGLSLATCRQEMTEALALAQQIGWLAGECETQWSFAITLATFGEFGEALARSSNALKIASEIDHRQWITAVQFVLGQVHLRLLNPHAAAEHLALASALADEIGSAWWIGCCGAFLAVAQVRLNQPDAARVTLEAAAAAIGLAADWAVRPPRTLIERYLHWAGSETALAAGRTSEALALADRLIDAVINPAGEPLPDLLKLKAEALMSLGRLAEAERALDLAAAGARQHDTRPILWQIEAARARLAALQGRPAEALLARAAARAVIEDLASTLAAPEQDRFRARALGHLGD